MQLEKKSTVIFKKKVQLYSWVTKLKVQVCPRESYLSGDDGKGFQVYASYWKDCCSYKTLITSGSKNHTQNTRSTVNS